MALGCSPGPQRPRLMARSLGVMVGQIKSICTSSIWAAGYTDFVWQSRFRDHIIRDKGSLKCPAVYRQ